MKWPRSARCSRMSCNRRMPLVIKRLRFDGQTECIDLETTRIWQERHLNDGRQNPFLAGKAKDGSY
jgi:hypothetical protein